MGRASPPDGAQMAIMEGGSPEKSLESCDLRFRSDPEASP
jgi:hypothetical protein